MAKSPAAAWRTANSIFSERTDDELTDGAAPGRKDEHGNHHRKQGALVVDLMESSQNILV